MWVQVPCSPPFGSVKIIGNQPVLKTVRSLQNGLEVRILSLPPMSLPLRLRGHICVFSSVVEQRTFNPSVRGSSPRRRTISLKNMEAIMGFVDKIVCPYQDTAQFSFDICVHCHSFEQSSGMKYTAPKCRKQRTKSHQQGFVSACLLHRIGLPYEICVEAKEDPK